jgi:hypothetical protein
VQVGVGVGGCRCRGVNGVEWGLIDIIVQEGVIYVQEGV